MRGAYDTYMKIALVHHHPYPYLLAPGQLIAHPYEMPQETSVFDPRGWVGRESFIKLEGAEQLLSWCAGRDVSLILHGHRHIPRLIQDRVSDGADPPRFREITTVGCGSSLGAGNGPLSFNIIEWQPASNGRTVDFQVDRGDGQGFRSALIDSAPASA